MRKISKIEGILWITGFVLLVFLVFKDLLNVYFQQDEWHFFGWMLFAKEGGILEVLRQSLKAPRIFASLTFQLLFTLFGTNELPYNYLSLSLHGINSFLVFYLAFRLTGKRLLSLVAGLFFALNAVHIQAISWIGASVGSLFSTLFSLLSLVVFLSYLEERTVRKYILALVFWVIAVLYKETSLSLFLLLPVLDYLLSKRSPTKIFKDYKLPFLFGSAWAIFRFLPSLSGVSGPYISSSQAGNFWLKLAYNFFVYPLENISLSFIAPQTLYKWTNFILMAKFSQFAGNDLLIQTIGSEYVSVFLSLAILLVTFLFSLIFEKDQLLRKWFLVSFAFIFVGTLPLLILPKSTAYFESRNYYLLTVGSGILFGSFVYSISRLGALFKENLSTMFFFFAILISFSFLYYHARYSNFEIVNQIKISSARKSILSKIFDAYPTIPEKAIFYTESNSYYLGPKAPLMPFQSGFGHILLVKYVEKGEIRPEFLREDYLWDIWSQGYKKIDDQGFGYFREYPALIDAIERENFPVENVIAFRWQEGRLEDITQETRKRLGMVQ